MVFELIESAREALKYTVLLPLLEFRRSTNVSS